MEKRNSKANVSKGTEDTGHLCKSKPMVSNTCINFYKDGKVSEERFLANHTVCDGSQLEKTFMKCVRFL